MTIYRVVKEYDTEDLAYKVNGLLGKGWELQGGVSASQRGSFSEYRQAMVRKLSKIEKIESDIRAGEELDKNRTDFVKERSIPPREVELVGGPSNGKVVNIANDKVENYVASYFVKDKLIRYCYNFVQLSTGQWIGV